MPRLIKILLFILAIPVGLFLIGFFGALFGFYTPPDKPIKVTSNPAPRVESVQKSKPDRVVDTFSRDLKDFADATAALNYLSSEKFIFIENEKVQIDKDKFASLTAEDALTIYNTFRRANTDEAYKRMRVVFFAGCAEMEKGERDRFAKKSGAVFPPSFWTSGPWRGDFVTLFFWHDSEFAYLVEPAIAQYAQVLDDDEMIYTLDYFGAIELPDRNLPAGSQIRWEIYVEEKLAQFSPDTLMAIHDSIKKTIGGDRPRLRKALIDLAKSRHTSTSP